MCTNGKLRNECWNSWFKETWFGKHDGDFDGIIDGDEKTKDKLN